MVVAEHVQSAVHDESDDLLAQRYAQRVCGTARHVRRDVDVADERRAAAGLPVGKRDDVGIPVAAQVRAIEAADGAILHERDREQHVAAPLSAQHLAHDVGDAAPAQRDPDAVERHADHDAQVPASSTS